MRRSLTSASLAAALLLLVACQPHEAAHADRLAALEKQVADLRAHVEHEEASGDSTKAAEGPELGAQMLELQIRHARLWQAGQGRNWLLSQFQLAELREAFAGVVETNGDHASLQPQRLAVVLPAMVDPALNQLQAAIDAHDGAKFDVAYDALSASCNGCHTAAGHGFLVIQRPRTPMLDNLRAEAAAE